MQNIGVYVHIPFCKQKCYYCDFISYANQKGKMENYVQAIQKEIENAKEILSNRLVDTIYIGGGTPSFLDSKFIIQIMEQLKKCNIAHNAEITIEINPGTINKEKLEDYKIAGINRISMGVQSTSDKLLKEIGRIHTKQEAIEAYKLIRSAGFKNVNLDFIIGLPNQTIVDIKNEIKIIKSLQPEHISMYSLIVEENTKIANLLERKILKLPEEDEERDMYWTFKKNLEKLGYIHYEISNFAKETKESKHNIHCWEQKEYIGFGVAAHSYLNSKRFSNIDCIDEYCKNIKEQQYEKNKILQEEQNKEEKMNEYMLLGLRKIEGINTNSFYEKFQEDAMIRYNKNLKKLQEKGLVEINKIIAENICYYKIKLTQLGLDFANLVWQEFV